MSSEQFSVRVFSERLVFSAGHFISLKDGVCEALHGHDYRVTAELRGPLNDHRYVVDYVTMQDLLAGTLAEIDHRVMLPTEHPAMRVETLGDEIHVRFASKRWILPASDCCLLPVANTTTELLARYIGQRLLADLQQHLGFRPERLRIEITETYGLAAVWDFGC